MNPLWPNDDLARWAQLFKGVCWWGMFRSSSLVEPDEEDLSDEELAEMARDLGLDLSELGLARR
jgi:hypothetical protein